MFSSLHRTKKNRPKSDSGLTLIECLVAIVVIALTSASIAPVLVLSVATRVQNQKAEQALQLAQGEVDRVRLLVERSPTYTSADLKLAESSAAPLLSTPSATSRGTAITTVGKPTSSVDKATWASTGYTASDVVAKRIDTDEDGIPDFVIQSFRGGSPMVGGTMPVAFDMGVRVYDYSAMNANNIGSLDTIPAGLGFTSGAGQRGRRPLAVVYTQIINSDHPLAVCTYMGYLRASVPTNMNCN